MEHLIKRARAKSTVSDFSRLSKEIINYHGKNSETSQHHINKIYGEIIPLNIFAKFLNADYVELCPENHQFDGTLYWEAENELYVEITRMGVDQNYLQIKHLKEFGYCHPFSKVEKEGNKKNGNERIIKQGSDLCSIDRESIFEKFSKDLLRAIRKKVSNSQAEDFVGVLIVSFSYGDYPIQRQCMKEFLEECDLWLEKSFSKIYVVGTFPENCENIVHQIPYSQFNKVPC